MALGCELRRIAAIGMIGMTAATNARGGAAAPRPRGAVYRYGERVHLAAQAMGPRGGVIDARLPPPFNAQIRVLIPAGALERDVRVALEMDRGALVPAAGTWAGLCLSLAVDRVRMFQKAVQISIPQMAGDREVMVGYYVDPDGGLDAIDAGPPAANPGTAVFTTLRPGCFTWIVAPVH